MLRLSRPTIKVYDLGGTITSANGKVGIKYGAATVQDMINSTPRLGEIAEVEFETVFKGGSPDLTASVLLSAARRINTDFATGRYTSGLVLAGTDLTEEITTILSLAMKPSHPLGVTGAIKRITDLSSDGQINVFNALCLLVSPEAKDRGVMYVSQNHILEARSVTKVSTTSVNAFTGVKLGEIRGNTPYFYYPPGLMQNWPLFNITNIRSLPRVSILYGHLDHDENLFDHLASRGARGIVLAGMGAGSWTTKGGDAMQRLKDEGKKPVVVYVSASTSLLRYSASQSLMNASMYSQSIQEIADCLDPTMSSTVALKVDVI
ncbi:hypothetical protein S40293_10072, partial [Stachybotrys chartarum IBT 40293]